METQRLAVAVMHCQKCVANVTQHYEDVPGVQAVAVDLSDQTAEVTYDPACVSLDDLLHALDDTNFKVAVMPADGVHPFAAEIAADAAEKAAKKATESGGEKAGEPQGALQLTRRRGRAPRLRATATRGRPRPSSAWPSRGCTARTALLPSRAITARPPG